MLKPGLCILCGKQGGAVKWNKDHFIPKSRMKARKRQIRAIANRQGTGVDVLRSRNNVWVHRSCNQAKGTSMPTCEQWQRYHNLFGEHPFKHLFVEETVVQLVTSQPDQDVIDLAENLLGMARTGELQSLAFIGARQGAQTMNAW